MKDMMSYKEYYGSVHYSDEDRIFYEGSDVDGLCEAFEDAVDDYLDLCAKEGKIPERPFKGSFNVRTGSDLHREAALLAKAKGTTLNTIVTEALEKYLSA